MPLYRRGAAYAGDPQVIDIAGLTPTDNGVVIGNGTNFVVESGATLKTSLALVDGQLNGALLGSVVAAAGKVGELVTSSVLAGSALALTSDVALSITSVSLTAGDWDVWGTVGLELNAATVVTQVRAAINTTTNNLGTPAASAGYTILSGTLGTGAAQLISTGVRTISIDDTTTVYLVGRATFAVNTAAGYGFLAARRVR